MKLQALAIALLAALAGIKVGAQVEPPSAPSERYKTWLAPPPSEQLYFEGLDDQKGMGRIFVPAMTSGANEPHYAVFQNDELIGEQATGSSIFLMPGHYTVKLGTGALEQRLVYEVDIDRGQTHIIEPSWSALTVEVLDESRNYVRQDMHLYDAETLESYGVISAIDPELGEQLQTLVLPPGWYKIVERGLDVNTYINFTTVLVEAGAYTPFTIVVNAEDRSFLGAGVLTSSSQLRQRRHLRLFGAIHGSAILNSANDAATKKQKSNLTLLAQFENRALFDKYPHYYLNNNLLELGLLRQQGEVFQITQDRLQLKNTYVYYLNRWLGGYTRLELTTHLFPTIVRFGENRNILIHEKNHDRINWNADQIRLAPALYPLNLKEGLGANVTPLQTFKARLSLRAGFGYRQAFNKKVYQQSAGLDTVYSFIPDAFLRGIEMSLVSNLSLLRNLTMTSDFDVLFPIGERRQPLLDFENILSLALTRNVTLEHVYRLNRDPNLNWAIQEQFVLVRISYFVF